MAIIKCKMCGGDLNITEQASVVECEYCGSRQTIPAADNEKKLTLFSRANRLRFACEFDKAAGVYEALAGEFPEEAEAYWGLVLCKYGIEYVDDPATGRKIPTCHRSSFDSVMDDANLDQALENADVVARRVYREEAKQIEELRRGIIEVSGKEEPYDIFICYKETGEEGQRTLDSVLAQDVYDTLTSRGYRVFFSRITLEDKLGQEYEPYIFAALNSAKIMLAFGTDYEYFNAVWVKNEWSRYLQLMTQDKSKHLIPCYKGIDAYDMPKEFARLQAQDMGKVGATQDLLRGIEKLLRKEDKGNSNLVQQVVQTGGPNVQAMVDRGNIALEDGEWEKAAEFFDRALDMNAQCAQAYLGKALAEAQCASLDTFVRIHSAQNYSPRKEILQACAPDKALIEQTLKRFYIRGYLTEQEILSRFTYDLSYTSIRSGWEARKEQANNRLQSNKMLSRALKYMDPENGQKLRQAMDQILQSFQSRIQEADSQDQKTAAAIQEAYRKHIQAGIEELSHLHVQKSQERDTYYDTVYYETLRDLGRANSVWALRTIRNKLDEFGNYKEAEEYARICREKIQWIEARDRERKKLNEQLASLEGYRDNLGVLQFKERKAVESQIAQLKERLKNM